MQTLEEQIADWCVHFNGIQNTACKIGIPYKSVRREPGKLPCIKSDGCCDACPSATFLTGEEVVAQVEKINKEVAAFLTTMAENKVCPHCQYCHLKYTI